MKTLALLTLLLTTAAAPLQPQGIDPRLAGRQVLDAEMLRAAGVRRLGDALALIEGWALTTVDGFTWGLSPEGLSSFGQPSWNLMIDGQPVDLDLFGVRGMDRLPVPLERVDSLVIMGTPGLRQGVFGEAGTIHVHTRRPRDGLSLRARGATANETGDPGPFGFTDLATPNIDRISSEVSAVMGLGGRRAYVDLSAGWREHFVTDPLVRERNTDISLDFPLIEQTAFSFTGGLESATGHHNLFAAHSTTHDFFYLKQLGREVPAESPLTHLGIDGTEWLSRETALRYRLSYSSSALQERANSLDIDFDWDIARWTANIEAIRRLDTREMSIGAAYRNSSASTAYQLSGDGFDLVDLYARLGYQFGRAMQQELAVSLTGGAGAAGLKGALTHQWRVAAQHDVVAAISYVERLPEEDGRIWYWHRRGYDFLTDNGIGVTLNGEESETRTMAGHVRWAGRLREALSARVGIYLRSHSDLALEEQPFQFDSTSRSFSGPVRLLAQQGGWLAGSDVGAVWQASPRLQVFGYYRYQDALGGDASYKDVWRTVPRHSFQLKAWYTPWPSVSLWGMLDYRSSAYWSDYAAADVQSEGTYRANLSDALTLNLAAQKWFWERRLRINLKLHNILDDAVPYHPMGTAYGLSFIVQGELQLAGLGGAF
ncbi:MAG: hypothetical protein JSU87_13740 [Gemmatimonadota bacterium]|nr:MAG: hypothetical protein JSU87_13740 [Gemmatimonadota bacterium]